MLNANIILAGQPVDAIGSLQRGTQAAAQTNALRTQNDLTRLFQTQGAGILAGDQGALNALAGIDPMAAMGMKAQQQSFRINEEQLKISYENARLRGMELAATMDARTRQEEAARLEKGLAGAAFFYQNKDKAGYENFLRQNNLDPASLPFEAFPAHAAGVKGAMDALTTFAPPKPEGPLTEAAKLKADFEAGRITAEEYRLEMARRAPRGENISVDPSTGMVTITRGAGVGSQTGEPLLGEVYNPGEVQAAVGLIDQILETDPKTFNRITGTVMGGGGNNIDDLSAPQRFYYGEEGVSAIEKLGQLQSQAWLAARQMLKGGGPITDYESRKAEAAVARLSRAKGAAELKAALEELRDAITEGEAKLRAAGKLPSPAPTAPQAPTTSTMSDDDLLNMYGE